MKVTWFASNSASKAWNAKLGFRSRYRGASDVEEVSCIWHFPDGKAGWAPPRAWEVGGLMMMRRIPATCCCSQCELHMNSG